MTTEEDRAELAKRKENRDWQNGIHRRIKELAEEGSGSEAEKEREERTRISIYMRNWNANTWANREKLGLLAASGRELKQMKHELRWVQFGRKWMSGTRN